MKEFLKYLGVIIVIIGALLLIIPALMDTDSNVTMGAGGLLLVLGFVGHIVVNKYVIK